MDLGEYLPLSIHCKGQTSRSRRTCQPQPPSSPSSFMNNTVIFPCSRELPEEVPQQLQPLPMMAQSQCQGPRSDTHLRPRVGKQAEGGGGPARSCR